MNAKPPDEIVSNNLRLSLKTRQLFAGEREIGLSRKEFDLIAELMRHPGEIFSPDRIWTEIWGEDPAGNKHIVAVHIKWLREKIEDDVETRRISVVRGVGYRFDG